MIITLSTFHHIFLEIFNYSCEFGGEKCDPDAFKVVYTDFGGCFVFNWNKSKSLSAQDIGSNFGLKVTLNLEQYEYMPGGFYCGD